MLIEDFDFFNRCKNYKSNISGMDAPKLSKRSQQEWYSYPIQDFDYSFNSWGFRGPEYTQHLGKTVNICLGDSFTVNLGGPIEHSWCSQLAEYFDIPTLNLGIDGAGNDMFPIVCQRACEIFDVQNIFVMYSYLHRRIKVLKNGYGFGKSNVWGDESNFEHFTQHRLTNAFESILPYWNLDPAEQLFLNDKGIHYFGQHRPRSEWTDKQHYLLCAGTDWPSFDEYINGATCPEEDKYTLETPYTKFVSRDGWHMNYDVNKYYAEYYYNQWKQR